MRNSVFEKAAGTAPEAGVDIEPFNASESLSNITFDHVAFQNNTRVGLNVYNAFAAQPKFNLRLNDCTIAGNGKDGLTVGGRYTVTGIDISGNFLGNNLKQPWYARPWLYGGIMLYRIVDARLANITVTEPAGEALSLNGGAAITIANASLSGGETVRMAASLEAAGYAPYAVVSGRAVYGVSTADLGSNAPWQSGGSESHWFRPRLRPALTRSNAQPFFGFCATGTPTRSFWWRTSSIPGRGKDFSVPGISKFETLRSPRPFTAETGGKHARGSKSCSPPRLSRYSYGRAALAPAVRSRLTLRGAVWAPRNPAVTQPLPKMQKALGPLGPRTQTYDTLE